MLGVRPVQDENENSSAQLGGAKGAQLAPSRGQFGGRAFGKSLALGAAPLTARKALGNITNQVTERKGALQEGLGGKGGAPAKTPALRKRLGDITNTPAREAAAPAAHKPPAAAAKAAAAVPKPAAAAPAAPRPRPAAVWDDDGEIERPAGKTWDQLQQERQRAENNAIAARVNAILSRPHHYVPPEVSFPYRVVPLSQRPRVARPPSPPPSSRGSFSSELDFSWPDPGPPPPLPSLVDD